MISGIEHGWPLRAVMSVSESVPKKKRKFTKLQAEASAMKRGRDDTELIYGRSQAGRYLFIVTAEALDGGLYIVTARGMTDSEKREFKKKAR